MQSSVQVSGKDFSKGKLWLRILISIGFLGGLAWLVSLFPAETGSSWYHDLKQPAFAPPYWLPFVMWTLVYVLLGTALGILWNQAETAKDQNLILKTVKGIFFFGIHLLFNLIFPIILIGLEMPVLSLIDILILIALIVALIFYLHPVNKTASLLLVPYLIWIIYAASLNVAILVLN